MSRFDSAKRVMSGTWGEVWFDGDLVSETYKFSAKLTYNKTEIGRNGSMAVDTKVTSYKGTGSVGMRKVNSRMLHLLADKIKDGKDVRFTIIGKLDDPDAYGSERLVIENAWFNKLTLQKFENAKMIDEEYSGGFTDYYFPDLVKVR